MCMLRCLTSFALPCSLSLSLVHPGMWKGWHNVHNRVHCAISSLFTPLPCPCPSPLTAQKRQNNAHVCMCRAVSPPFLPLPSPSSTHRVQGRDDTACTHLCELHRLVLVLTHALTLTYRDYTRLCRGKKGDVISGRYALIGSWLVTKISQV